MKQLQIFFLGNVSKRLTKGDGPAVSVGVSFGWLHAGHWLLLLTRIPHFHFPWVGVSTEIGRRLVFVV